MSESKKFRIASSTSEHQDLRTQLQEQAALAQAHRLILAAGFVPRPDLGPDAYGPPQVDEQIEAEKAF